MEQDEGKLERENKGKLLIAKDEELSKWTHLPSDILELIMKRLKLVDYLGIRGVCSSWRVTITEAIAKKHCHPLPELPLAFFNKHKRSILPSRFFSIKTEQECSLKSKSTLLHANHHVYHGVVEGWMILSAMGTKDIFFLNPVINEEVRVPSFSFPSNSPILNRSDLYIGKMVATSSPKCEDCVVVGLINDYAHIHITYCRVNSEKPWAMIEAKKEDTGNFMDMEIFNGKLYVITDMESSMLVYDLQDSTDEPPKPKVLGILPLQRSFQLSSRNGNEFHVNGELIIYLTRGHASEELLLIYLFHSYIYEADNVGCIDIIKQYVIPPKITHCYVFKLDTSNNNWLELDHLGDRVLFLGLRNSFVMSRAALNSTEELITENSIYFAFHTPCTEKPWLGSQLGRLCLTDKSIKLFSLEQFGHEVDFKTLWFLPSAW